MKKILITVLFASTIHLTAQTVIDTRSINSPPTSYNQEVKFEFKSTSAIGLPWSSYTGLMTFAPWRDNSGGSNYQLGFYNSSIFFRTGQPESSSWNSWAKILIEDSNGNVGVGKINPTAKLDVNGSIKTISIVDVAADGASGHVASRVYLNSHNDYRGAGVFSLGQTNNWFYGNPYTDHANSFMIGVAPKSVGISETAQKQYAKFYINGNGNVGIGTSTPDAKLSVNGQIHAKEVKVDLTGWPDYVFANTYQLPTLANVEKHIKEKGHLQNIPSAKEVAKNGIELGEMNKKLLQKIEELTLYAVEQEKKIAMSKKNDEKLFSIIKQQSLLIKKIEKRIQKLEK